MHEEVGRTRKVFPTYEGNIAESFFGGITWVQSVDMLLQPQEFEKCALRHFLTQTGYLYFFPAFLTLSVIGPSDADWPDSVCFDLNMDLCPKSAPIVIRNLKSIFDTFSIEQLDLTKDVLVFLDTVYVSEDQDPDNPAAQALRTGWNELPENREALGRQMTKKVAAIGRK